MIYKTFSICALLFLAAMAGCKKAENMKSITQISIVSESGTILPELQWREEVDIQPNAITFTRTGNADKSEVNTGSWSVPVDSAKVSALFQTLEKIDRSSVERVDPLDQPDGGGSQYYQIIYADGKTWSLDYTPGITYTNGELFTQPIQDFIEALKLPTDAANRYK